ncbi:DNA polymerase III subunit delta' [Actinopolymorpha alba]|uniref:DNA polymerase III subunit delta' n=1 Tax=Actinopolymorpha alba TaxID=533267 RepID=UPI0003741AA9|nr:DNA polymerase III subunit delta' [Actinopolymorpha alba]
MSEVSGVWADLVGQEPTVAVLRTAARAAAARLAAEAAKSAGEGAAPSQPAGRSGMTHAWLITGPPGSGRSNTARAFAAALQCERQGCGECTACRTSLAGTNPDVTLVRTEQLSLRVDEIRELVRKSAMSPVGRRWQVLVVEDADRLTEQAADALLKSLEEPADRTVWVLCAPTVEDAVPTIRSRCRLLVLRTPPTTAVAQVLQRRYAVSPDLAVFAARASQGHIGRARALATQEEVRARREQVLSVPSKLRDLAGCLTAAASLVELAAEEARAATAELDATEKAELERALGVTGSGGRGPRPRQLQAAQKELEDQQKVRAKRLQRDALDRALLDLVAFYRDVLVVALGASAELVNEELRDDIERRAHANRPELILRQIDAILACRDAIAANVAPLLAVESMTIALLEPTRR